MAEKLKIYVEPNPEEIQDQLVSFTRRHMRKELKLLTVEGAFMQLREVLCQTLPGNMEAITMLQLLETAEVMAEQSIKEEVWDGL